MKNILRFILGSSLAIGLCGTALAADSMQPLPDPGHIPFSLPKDLKWTESDGEQKVALFGDPAKPGLYGILIKWLPGHFSKPHFHSADRYIYVVSGTWWVSSSSHYDPSKTYPLPAGTLAKDIANTIHWDGAKAGGEPAVLELVGVGPASTVYVDDSGKALPPAKKSP